MPMPEEKPYAAMECCGKCCVVACSTNATTCEDQCTSCCQDCKKQNGIKMPCPTSCPDVYEPVCGTNNRTYGSSCQVSILECLSDGKIKMDYKGMCIDKCMKGCPKNVAPVCGTDMRNYTNSCFLDVATCRSRGMIKLRSNGTCPILDPYCNDTSTNCAPWAKSGQCDKNPKFMNIACRKSCDKCGECPPPTCDLTKCASGMYCKLIQPRCMAGSLCCKRPICVKGDPCGKKCTRQYKPVCGNNKRTYSNSCVLAVQTCKSKGKIRKAYNGKCKSKKKVKEMIAKCKKTRCKRSRKYVCASNGKTYMNSCYLKKVTCTSLGKTKKAYNGRCKKRKIQVAKKKITSSKKKSMS